MNAKPRCVVCRARVDEDGGCECTYRLESTYNDVWEGRYER